ncbi:MAG: SpoVA/SpoVAEb family sporulation membrane protein [Lachnospiraceae bacterium]
MEKNRYNKYVKEVTPTHSLWKNMFHAFWIGGVICVIGQILSNVLIAQNLSKETAGTWVSIILVFLGVLLTGLNLYPSIAKLGGAGALVPITGFANGVAAPAIEFQKEGEVYGIGSKIFSIAGSVVLYGILTSSALGLLYWVIKSMGWI